MNCRHCAAKLERVFIDLGHAPLSNGYLTAEALRKPEVTYPLKLYVCDTCHLVQTEDHAGASEIFHSDYAYFSSMSRSWLEHAHSYTKMIRDRLSLSADSFVVEVASNDGYLLRNFVEAGIPCLGIEPTDSTAAAAEKLGIPVLREFFGEALGRKLAAAGKSADLICGNNVYAHVPDLDDFTRGLAALLKPQGVLTLEFPHLMRLVEDCQFDTIYHEHFSYFLVGVVQRIFTKAGLRLFDVEQLTTHGGSLRVYGCLQQASFEVQPSVSRLFKEEEARGLYGPTPYVSFQSRAEKLKNDLLRFLIDAKRDGKSVAGYGAAAKGNTLLNFAGVKPDLLPFISDAAPSKQGRYTPGAHIPILPPKALTDHRPDYVLILPWNIADEVRGQLQPLAKLGTKFVTAVPELKIV